MAVNPTELVLSRLQNVKQVTGGYSARCPAHDDKISSLSISEGDDGRCLIHCHAGCDTDCILSAIGLKLKDLYPPKQGAPITNRATIERVYPYVDENGTVLYEVVRYKPKGFKQRVPNGSGGYSWSMKGVTRVLYQLPAIKTAIEHNAVIFIVEGEKDVHNMHDRLNLPATCNVGGAGKWQLSYSKALTAADVVILPDNDKPGREHAEHVAQALQGYAKSVRVLELPGLTEKGDVSDWIAAGGTREELVGLADSCPQWEPRPPETQQSTDTCDTDPFDLRLTDAGNARALVGKHGENIRFDHDSGQWLMWTGTHWETDRLCTINRFAEETIRGMYDELSKLGDKQAEKMLRHIRANLSKSRLDAMVDLAGKQESVAVDSDMLDADNWLLNCRNGVVDLKTGRLRPHSRADLMTKLVPVDYDPAAICPRWEQFLSEVFDGDEELIAYVRRAIGYTLTGDTSEQVFFMLHGNGSNGKSTLVNVVREIMNDYHVKTATDTILEKKYGSGIPNDIARLRGARFVSAIEANPSQKLAEELVKELTGGDAVTARFLRQEFFDFVPTFKLWLACNHKPGIDGQDNGIWRRIKLIPFTVQFDGDSKDAMLPDKLRMEYPGILRWMVEGCLQWQTRGLGKCSAVDAATNEYRSDMDILAEFIDSCCVLSDNAQVASSELYAAYSTWCDGNGIRHPYQQKTFTQRLQERGFKRVRRRGGMLWQGVELNAGNEMTEPIYIDDEVSGVGSVGCVGFSSSSIGNDIYRNKPKMPTLTTHPTSLSVNQAQNNVTKSFSGTDSDDWDLLIQTSTDNAKPDGNSAGESEVFVW
ncbi:MAG: phage/plasmid primase, P4 family [Armatimonadota bacterium]